MPEMPEKETREVEFLFARDDHTWDTAIEEVPEYLGVIREDIINWAENNLLGLDKYRDVVMIGLYSFPGEN